MVSKPTRGDNVLDLFLTSNHTLVNKVEILSGISDHEISISNVSIKPKMSRQKPRSVPIYRKADWNKFKSFMALKSSEILCRFQESTVEEIWNALKTALDSGIKQFVPIKKLSSVVVDFLFVVTPIVGVCNFSMFCCALLYVHFGVAVVLVGGGLVALLGLSFWCLVVVGRPFLAVPRGSLQFVFVVFPDHTHLLFLNVACPGLHRKFADSCLSVINCIKNKSQVRVRIGVTSKGSNI